MIKVICSLSQISPMTDIRFIIGHNWHHTPGRGLNRVAKKVKTKTINESGAFTSRWPSNVWVSEFYD